MYRSDNLAKSINFIDISAEQTLQSDIARIEWRYTRPTATILVPPLLYSTILSDAINEIRVLFSGVKERRRRHDAQFSEFGSEPLNEMTAHR